MLLGNGAAHHAQATQLLALANWIGEHTGASVGYLTEAANTVGAQWVGAQPQTGGKNAGQMLAGGLKAAVLLNTEPEFDSAAGAAGLAALEQRLQHLSARSEQSLARLGSSRRRTRITIDSMEG
mgnify:CR=1 FL=1